MARTPNHLKASKALIGKRVRLRHDVESRGGDKFSKGELAYVDGVWRRYVNLTSAPWPKDGRSLEEHGIKYIRRVEATSVDVVD